MSGILHLNTLTYQPKYSKGNKGREQVSHDLIVYLKNERKQKQHVHFLSFIS